MTGNSAGTGGAGTGGNNGNGGARGAGHHDGIELADAVESVRNQLIEAATRGTGRPLAFEVGDIQMEFTLELRKEVKGSARVKAWVVEAGADAGRATGHTHKVAFTLKPRDVTTGEAWQIGNEADGSTERFGQGRARP
ncbi:hypothetical protein EDD93_2520 [Streptomyces sp. 840.1]|uniref:trypco2 family protein n=1 Tax=Streptomyces sp. 840.1 TaxID=2485152 RepID=UPI000F98EBC9|nr:trypco2 family protein [Streptomyces sp. 840.1]ROQ68067.1 hypothetical protein EDD93_2520 [Streptomyces sp. 840.1]